jgi:hypothetical protein
LKCEKCGSSDIRLFKVIHSDGTRTETVSAVVEPKWNTKPLSSSGKQKIQGTRTVRTELARQCSPPSSADGGVWILAGLPAFVLSIYAAFKGGFYVHSFWIGILAFVLVYWGFMATSFKIWRTYLGGNAKIAAYNKKLDEWHRSWLCGRCGGVTISARK